MVNTSRKMMFDNSRDCFPIRILMLIDDIQESKGVNDYENSSRHMSAGRPSIIKEKKRRRLPRLVKLNQTQTVVQLIAQYNAVPSASASEHTVQ
ncbi:UNVERIFIED_CONTAM: hypothetical protein NCL1_07573 [Trichonephila clavipes]